MTINEITEAAKVTERINRQPGQLVLFRNGPDNPEYVCPGIFKAGEASIKLSKDEKILSVHIPAQGPVYWLTNGRFVPDSDFAHGRTYEGRNFFPGMEGSSISICLEAVTKALKDHYHYEGPLPPDLA